MQRSIVTQAQTRAARPRIRAAAVIGLLALAAAGTASSADKRELTAVEHAELPGQRIQLTLTLSGPAPEPKTFTVDQPARLSLDLPDTRLAIDKRRRDIDIGDVRAVAFAEGGERTRMVVELSRLVPHETSVSGNQVQVRLGASRSDSRLSEAARPERRDTETRAAGAPGSGIEDLDFRRTETGAGRVTVTLDGLEAPVNVTQEGSKTVARFPGARLPESLIKRLDVIDFATPVKYVDATNTSEGAQITVTPLDDAEFDQVAYQTDERFIIELQTVTRAEREQREEAPEYTGQNISLSFQNVDIRALLQIIADVAEVNMVVSENVTGSMALQLENVPWDQALDIILASEGLGMRRQNNVIMVAPLDEIAQRERAELAAEQATTNLAPLTSEIIQINYANAADFASMLKSGETSLLSERGQVTIDERTNTLLVRDTRGKLEEIRRVINRLDIPVRQVLIESRIVVATREFSRDLGVQSMVDDSAGAGLSADPEPDGFVVNLPVANPAGSLTTSILSDDFNLDLTLSALESENRGEVISSPRVITANSKEAKIEQGVEIPYLEAASSGAATVQFKEAVLSLTVTPQITPDERVIMNLFVTQDTQGDSINVQGGGQVPSINTRSLTTQVLVDNGETVVLGGIYEQEDRDIVSRVPVLGEIPLVGALFRNTNKQRDKRELLLFVTPKILKQGLALD